MPTKRSCDLFLRVASAVPLAVALAVGIPLPASSQSVSGTVRDARDRAPLPGAIVILLRGDTAKVTATLTGDDGTYRLRAPAPGSYGLRIDVVGYQSVRVPTFEIGGTPVVRDIVFPFERTTLPTIAITASSACNRVAGESGDAARLWSEARKALEATRLAQEERRFAVSLTRYERTLALPDSSVRSSRTFTQAGVSDNPFVSLPPDSIARTGYRTALGGKDMYLAPDARVLVSDQFVSAHCFGTRRGGPAGSMGLTFRPQRGAGHVDVDGVLWIDSASAELRSLEFRYTSVAGKQSAGGGVVEFGRMPNGVWGVKRWTIRMPMLEARVSNRRPDGALGRFVDTLVTGVQEVGGEVLTGVTAAGTGASTRIRGVVFDSTRQHPLAGAIVTLEGAGLTARSRTDGGFVIDSIPDAGTFRLRFWHPRLDSLGMAMPWTTVRVRRGEETAADLAIPGAGAIARQRCSFSPTGPTRVVAGTVRRDGAPEGGAEVVALQWTAPVSAGGALGSAGLTRLSALASDSGRYVICRLTPGSPLWLIARSNAAWGTPVAVADSDLASVVDLSLPTAVSAGGTAAVNPHPTLDLGRAPVGDDEARLEGMVLFADDQPAAPAEIVIDGRVVSTTSPTGMFRLDRIGDGARQVAFRLAGFATVNTAVTVRRGEATILLVNLSRATAQVVASAESRSDVEPWRQAFEARRKRGQGVFFDRAMIERRGAQTFADLLRGVPGIKVKPDADGYRYVSTYGQTSMGNAGAANDCEMMFYVDGHPFEMSAGDVDRQLHVGEMAALEVYATSAAVPREFAGPRASCGVVVAWRRG